MIRHLSSTCSRQASVTGRPWSPLFSSAYSTSHTTDAHGWTILGCDSDAGGALALIRGDSIGEVSTVDIIDTPTVDVSVNGRSRTRISPEAIVDALNALELAPGTTAYLEEGGVEYGFSAQTAFIQGLNFGLWRGVLAGRGLDVQVVKPQTWKRAMGLGNCTKDASRQMAKALFPDAETNLNRKKDHGRADALLIAAYGHVHSIATLDAGRKRATTDSSSTRISSDPSLDANMRRITLNTDALCVRVREYLHMHGVAPDANINAPLPYFGPYFGMAGPELKQELKARGLKVSGKKIELLARLEQDDQDDYNTTLDRFRDIDTYLGIRHNI